MCLLGTERVLKFHPGSSYSMDCREFRRDHAAFLDDTLPAIKMVRAQTHIEECGKCAEHDTKVRRALLVFRNLPPIEPSADFNARLNSRIEQLRLHEKRGSAALPPRFRGTAAGSLFAAVLILAGGTFVVDGWQSQGELTLPPVVASQPDPAPSFHFAAPAIAASMSTGMPVWPAVFMAEQASMHFADAEFQFAAISR